MGGGHGQHVRPYVSRDQEEGSGGGEKEMEEEGKEEKPKTGVTWTRRLVDEAV